MEAANKKKYIPAEGLGYQNWRQGAEGIKDWCNPSLNGTIPKMDIGCFKLLNSKSKILIV